MATTPMTTMTTYDEVLAVAKSEGLRDKLPGQTDQEFLFSIAKSISSCPLDVWNALTPEAQKWYDVAVRRNNEMQPIPEPEGFRIKDQVIQANPIAPVIPISKPKPAPVLTRTPESGRTQSAVPNISNIPKTSKKPEGVVGAIRRTIILNPDWPTRKVHEHLVANGWPNLKLDVVAVNAGDIRRTVALVKELGFWRDK